MHRSSGAGGGRVWQKRAHGRGAHLHDGTRSRPVAFWLQWHGVRSQSWQTTTSEDLSHNSHNLVNLLQLSGSR